MISKVTWRFEDAAKHFVARLDEPQRDLVIAWDNRDRSLYLSVTAAPPPNVPGGQARAYAAPLSLLAALLILPADFHATLLATVHEARMEVCDSGVLAPLADVVGKAPQAWPAPGEVKPALEGALRAAGELERLALDEAAADAFREQGAPV